MSINSWEKLSEKLRFQISGQVIECNGPALRVSLPGAAIGDQVLIGIGATSKFGIVTGYNEYLTSIVCFCISF